MGPDERRAAAVEERDHGDTVGDGVPVGLMEALQPAAVAPFLAGLLDQLVEALVGEAALVRPARRLEQQAEEVLRIGVSREPAGDPERGGVDARIGRVVLVPRPPADLQPVAEDALPALGDSGGWGPASGRFMTLMK